MGEVSLGTSGWSYDEWEGTFYPSGTTSKLKYYSGIFRTAEIDSTFYAFPHRGMVFGWLKSTPEDFVFAAKLPKVITHRGALKLEKGVEVDMTRFLDLMHPLADAGKLGPLLIQLPPSFAGDYETLRRFLEVLPDTHRFAIEFRNEFWWREETWKLLKNYGVANVVVDEPLLPSDVTVTADFGFVRWHGRGTQPWYNYRYSEAELAPWQGKVAELRSKTKEVFGYFNNHFYGYAVANCLQMLGKLRVLTPTQAQVKQQVLARLDAAHQPTLLDYAQRETDVEGFLREFLDADRLRRARDIPSDEVSYEFRGPDALVAKVREYVIHVNLEARTIRHDCQDWAERGPQGKFCKHLGRLFLSLGEAEAKRILRRVQSEKEEWSFESTFKKP